MSETNEIWVIERDHKAVRVYGGRRTVSFPSDANGTQQARRYLNSFPSDGSYYDAVLYRRTSDLRPIPGPQGKDGKPE